MTLTEIENVENELATIPTASELETLRAFAAEINRKLNIVDPTPDEKRKIFLYFPLQRLSLE